MLSCCACAALRFLAFVVVVSVRECFGVQGQGDGGSGVYYVLQESGY